MGNIIGYQEAHGTIAAFETDVAKKIKNIVIDIEPAQTGSGDPSPDNVRPITGWTGASVHVTGANLWGGTALASDLVAISSVAQGSDDYGSYVRLAAAYASKKIYFSKFKPNTVYTVILTLKKSNTSGLTNLIIRYTDGTSQHIVRNVREADVVETFAFTTTAGKSIDYIGGSNQSGNTYLYYDECGIFEGVLTAEDFAAYAGAAHPVSWETEAGTVYGGSVTLNPDGSADVSACPYYASYAGEALAGPWISSMDVYSAGATPTTGAQVVDLGGEKTVTHIPAAYTPPILTLLGVNNVWADCGDISFIYPKTNRPEESISNVNLMKVRRNIIAAQAYGKTVDATLNLGTHQVYPTDSIESLRKYLTVVSRGSGATVTDYTLRGSIGTIGNNQIIIDCHPGIATIQVPVVANPTGILYEWDFTKSLTDERQNYTAILKTGEADEVPGKSEGTTPPVRGDTGVVFNNAQQVLRLLDSNIDSSALMINRTIQVDVAEFNYAYTGTVTDIDRVVCFIMFGDPLAIENKGSMLYTRGITLNSGWQWRFWKKLRENEEQENSNETVLLNGKNAISGHTIGVYRNNSGTINFYVDGEYKKTSKGILPSTGLCGLQIGTGGRPQYGGAFYDARITGVRIYNGKVTQ